MSRGNARQTVFRDDSDYQRLSKGLETVVSRLGWDLLCFVLMPNHFHCWYGRQGPTARGECSISHPDTPTGAADVIGVRGTHFRAGSRVN